jgi:hypothetical protein
MLRNCELFVALTETQPKPQEPASSVSTFQETTVFHINVTGSIKKAAAGIEVTR